ncbi:hypothetical protein D3C80_1557050 [compost metagenome]
MRQTRFIFGLINITAFAGIISKQVDNVGEQAINLFFTRLLNSKQRFECFKRGQQALQQLAMTCCAVLQGSHHRFSLGALRFRFHCRRREIALHQCTTLTLLCRFQRLKPRLTLCGERRL